MIDGKGCTYQVKMYCKWLLRRLTSAARPMGTPLSARVMDSTRSGPVVVQVYHG